MASDHRRLDALRSDDLENDEDDMDYAPTYETDDNEDEESDFDDDDGMYGEVEVEVEEAEEDGESEDERMTQNTRRVLRILRNNDLARIFYVTANGGYDDDARPRRRRSTRRDPFPKVPSEKGLDLMESGVFGSNEDSHSNDADGLTQKKQLAKRLLDRELAVGGFANRRLNQRLIAQNMIPSTNAEMIVHYDEPVYSGQFSEDGNFFFAVNKDYKVRMYDTSNPWKWRYYKTVIYPGGRWTLTDATLSPDNKYLAYTSLCSNVCLAPTDPNDMGDPYTLDFEDMGQGRHGQNMPRGYGGLGIFSIRFSGDGRNLVAGASRGVIIMYDIESRTALHRIPGHDDDVNAVCFADKSSPHILYSGSDDTTLKVWDTRSMGDSRAAGAFVGHIEGLTYIDSKGDGRYILSNGKDQSMKLWDIRMVISPSDFSELRPNNRRGRFDYRWNAYDDDTWYQDPNDNSLVTFRGHRVLQTLIRCHFSPPGSTDSRYVYSGSADGKVYIWNMDATLAGVVDVFATTKNSRPVNRGYGFRGRWGDDDDGQWRTCVRDASWHPNAPIIAASSWNGYGRSSGTVTAHSWNDGAEDDEAEPKMGVRLDSKLELDPSFYGTTEPTVPRRVLRGLRGLRAIIPEGEE